MYTGSKPAIQLIGLAVVLILSSSTFSVAQYTAEDGILNLDDFNFQQEKVVELNGEWAFYWKQLLNPAETDSATVTEYYPFPELWEGSYSSFGYATYRLRIRLPDEHPLLALSIPDLYCSYKLYVNGREFNSNGKVGKSEEEYTPKWIPATIPLSGINSDTLDLVLQIANFDHSKGGIRLPVKLGEAETLLRERELELGYTYSLTGALIMGALFFIGLYFFGTDQKSILYFSLFCLAYSYRIIGTDLYPLHFLFPQIPWIITVKLEYLTLYLSGFFFGIYTIHLYPDETSKRFMHILSGISLLFTFITLFTTPYLFTYLLEPYLGILVIYIGYTMYVYIRAVLNERNGARFALASTGVVFFVFIYEMLVYLGLLPKSLFIYFWGYILFFFLQSLVLSYRFAISLKRATYRARVATEAKSQFLSTMSHEIRTPLNAIIGLSELLLNSTSEEQKTDFASNIKTSGENLLEIINNILDYTKFENLEVQIEYKKIKLQKLTEDILDMLKPLAAEKGLRLSASIDKDVPVFIYSDRTRIKQILINLMGNAIKFTDDGKVWLEIKSNDDPKIRGNLLFIVRDSGSGIPDEKTDQLFRSFSQVDSSLTRKHGGTGLGLAISKKLVEAMKGEIWLDQEDQSGATFKFTIQTGMYDIQHPKNDSKDEPSKTITADQLRLLVVEDNLLNQKVAQHILKSIGITPEIANNGMEAIGMTRHTSYDVILMDIEMPEMDGLEATRRIRASGNKSADAVIIAMTANAFAEDRESCLEAGMNDFIAKPVSINGLKDVLSKWVLSE